HFHIPDPVIEARHGNYSCLLLPGWVLHAWVLARPERNDCLRTTSSHWPAPLLGRLGSVLDAAQITQQSITDATHHSLVFVTASSEHPLFKGVVGRDQPGCHLLPCFGQRDEGVAVVLRIESSAKHALCLELLHLPGQGCPIHHQALLQIGV